MSMELASHAIKDTRVRIAVAGLCAGLTSVFILAAVGVVGYRPWAAPAVASPADENPPPELVGADERISWTPLPTSFTSNLVVSGDNAYVTVVDEIGADADFPSRLLSVDPQGETATVCTFDGRATALDVTENVTAIGVGSKLLVLDISTCQQLASVDLLPADGDPSSYIVAIELTESAAYVSINESSTVFRVDLGDESARAIDVGAYITAPQTLVSIPGTAQLLASTPFGTVAGMEPGSVLINVGSDEVLPVDLNRPFTFSLDEASATLIASQAVPGGGLTQISLTADGAVLVTPVASTIPWDGRWDLVATSNGVTWGAVQGSGNLYRSADGATETFELPRFSVVPTLPSGVQLTDADLAQFQSLPTEVGALAVLPDGTAVFVASGGGARIGVVGAGE